MALSKAERETTITISDDDDVWTISTSQRKMVTALLKNPNAKILDDYTFEGTRHLMATIPGNGITVRGGTARKSGSSQRTRKISGPVCKGTKSDGSSCGTVAKNGTGYCRHHQEQAGK